MQQGKEPDGSTQYLSGISPADKPWDKHRKNAAIVQALYDRSELATYANRIKECSQRLCFALEKQNAGEKKLRLQSARFCRVRHCPVCQWRRSLVWRARFLRAVPNVLQDHPNVNWLFLTLTVRNCPLDELRATVEEMNKAWKRLALRKQFPALGYVRSLEVTRSKDGSAHPHFHILMVVNSSYFKGQTYLSHEKWTELWKSCLRIDYTPILNIKAVKPKHKEKDNGIQIAILETLKYGVKESDLIADSQWLEELTKQLHKTRAVSVSGLLKKYISEEEPEDLINTDEEGVEEPVTEEEELLWFGWREMVSRYVQVEG
jgi:plasmid rolling circle replication initiator protein Rep